MFNDKFRSSRWAKFWFVPVALLLLTGVGRAQESAGLTLPAAVEIALRTHPLIRATASGREAAKAQVNEARAGWFPSVQLSETFINGNNPVFVFGSLLEQARFSQSNFLLGPLNNPDPLNNFRFGVSIKTPIFDQRRTQTRVNQAKFMERQAEAQTDMVEQRIRFEVLKAFYGLMLAKQKREVAESAVRQAEADVKRSRDRVETGTAVAADLMSAQVQLAEFRQQLIQADGDIRTAIAGLNTAMGLPVGSPQSVEGKLTARPFDIAGRDELMGLALQHRPELIKAGLSQQIKDEGAKGARGQYLPRVDVFANVGASRHNWVNGSGDYSVGASVTFDLLDLGRSARVTMARAAAEQAAGEQDNLAAQVRFEVVQSYEQFISARERLKVADEVIAYSSEALRIVQDRYNEGLTTITEVLRAETAHLRAQMNLLASQYDYYVGYAGVLLSSGRLTDVQAFK
ncbi:MAG: TolC family protein [Blastocatellales bacterium]